MSRIDTMTETDIQKIYDENQELKTLADNREKFIDWCIENHPEVIKEYEGWDEE